VFYKTKRKWEKEKGTFVDGKQYYKIVTEVSRRKARAFGASLSSVVVFVQSNSNFGFSGQTL